jgi:hypothetical protein
MCMMVAPANVQMTSIFATRHGGKQVLVYEAAVMTAVSNAMVLPIPIQSPSTNVDLLDLSDYSEFFSSLYVHFVDTRPPPPIGYGAPPSSPPPQRLEVFTVGSFEASIVPSLDDFQRLDARFRLPAGLHAVLAARYLDWAFVVYHLAPGNLRLHPFGVAFESRYTEHLFFPTVHFHDGADAPTDANFAHAFFAQGASLEYRMLPRAQVLSGQPAPTGHPLPGFIDMTRPLDAGSRYGRYHNVDAFAPIVR